jgi:hypothetical protein
MCRSEYWSKLQSTRQSCGALQNGCMCEEVGEGKADNGFLSSQQSGTKADSLSGAAIYASSRHSTKDLEDFNGCLEWLS